MEAGDQNHLLVDQAIEQRVWEPNKHGTTRVPMHDSVELWHFSYRVQRAANLREEFLSQAGPLSFVPEYASSISAAAAGRTMRGLNEGDFECAEELHPREFRGGLPFGCPPPDRQDDGPTPRAVRRSGERLTGPSEDSPKVVPSSRDARPGSTARYPGSA